MRRNFRPKVKVDMRRSEWCGPTQLIQVSWRRSPTIHLLPCASYLGWLACADQSSIDVWGNRLALPFAIFTGSSICCQVIRKRSESTCLEGSCECCKSGRPEGGMTSWLWISQAYVSLRTKRESGPPPNSQFLTENAIWHNPFRWCSRSHGIHWNSMFRHGGK
jgi:hypothetical protein